MSSIQTVGATGVAMHSVVAAMGGTRHIAPTPVFENRKHIHPEDVFESRKVIHPTARFEARQVFKFDPTQTMTMHLGKLKAAHGLPAQNVTNNAKQAAGHVRRYVQHNTQATILDMFI